MLPACTDERVNTLQSAHEAPYCYTSELRYRSDLVNFPHRGGRKLQHQE